MITLLAALLFAAPPSFEPLPAPPGIQVCLKLQGGELPGVKNGRVPYDQATQVFYLGLYDREKGKVGAPLFGSYELRQGILVFKPSHPLAAGKTYRALQPGIKNNHADFTAAPAPPSTSSASGPHLPLRRLGPGQPFEVHSVFLRADAPVEGNL